MENEISRNSGPKLRAAAHSASLRYISDTIPGISRKHYGKGYRYFTPKGKLITTKKTIGRINSLAIPPAYKNVWICPYDNGHMQATGKDAKNRKQYRYHPKWNKLRSESKFSYVLDFAKAIPKIRKEIAADLRQEGLTKERVLAALVFILDKSYVRIGNEEHARDNHTFGLTTLRKKYLTIKNGELEFKFSGKNKTPWKINIGDKRIAKVVKNCAEIPGYDLFKCLDKDGNPCEIDSEDLNHYLKYITGQPFTAKDFRTWAACKELFSLMLKTTVPENMRDTQIALNDMISIVAKKLGHTVAICKKSYLYPRLLTAWQSGEITNWYKGVKNKKTSAKKLFPRWWSKHYAG